MHYSQNDMFTDPFLIGDLTGVPVDIPGHQPYEIFVYWSTLYAGNGDV